MSNSYGAEEHKADDRDNKTQRRKWVAPNDHLCAVTDVGKIRERNEDKFHVSEDGHILMVADGMGGHKAGEVASSIAVEAIAEFFTVERRRTLAAEGVTLETLLTEALEYAHGKVREAAQGRDDNRGMGTTLVLACLQGSRLYSCHVGDVRCYIQRGSTLEQITKDHSVVGALVRAGQLTPEQGRTHPNKNEVLQAIGLSDGINPEVNVRELQEGDRVLLCSDGLWEALSDEEIFSIIGWEGTMRQCATQLVDRANQAGGYDNITVVLYEHLAHGERS